MSRHARRRTWYRFVVLHIRARGVPIAVAGLIVLALLTWTAGDWLAHRQGSSGPDERWVLAVLAPLLACVIVSSGLAGADEEMERSAPLRWRHVRAVHVGVAAALTGAGLALTGLWEAETYGAYELVRNTVGYLGLVAVGTVVLGARLGWIPALAYVLLILGIATPTPENAWWTWPVQQWPAGAAANGSAAVVAAAGLATYIWFGSRRSTER